MLDVWDMEEPHRKDLHPLCSVLFEGNSSPLQRVFSNEIYVVLRVPSRYVEVKLPPRQYRQWSSAVSHSTGTKWIKIFFFFTEWWRKKENQDVIFNKEKWSYFTAKLYIIDGQGERVDKITWNTLPFFSRMTLLLLAARYPSCTLSVYTLEWLSTTYGITGHVVHLFKNRLKALCVGSIGWFLKKLTSKYRAWLNTILQTYSITPTQVIEEQFPTGKHKQCKYSHHRKLVCRSKVMFVKKTFCTLIYGKFFS